MRTLFFFQSARMHFESFYPRSVIGPFRGLMGDGIKQFVLRLGKKHLRGLVRLVLVAAQGKQVAYLLVEPLLRSTYIADTSQQLVKVVRSPVRILQPFVIHCEALHKIFCQMLRCPLPELCSSQSPDTVSHGDNHLQ